MDKAILFDFDGTLADTLEFYIKAYDYALRKFSVSWSDKEIVKNCFGATEKAICQKLGVPGKTNEFQENYFFVIRSLFVDAKLFDDAIPLLDCSRRKGYKLGIITFAHKWYIDMMLRQFNLNHYFQSVISADDVTKSKPDPEAVFISCKNLGVKPSDSYVVGDSKSDILMGKAAKSKTILVRPEKYNYFIDSQEILTSKPDFTVNNLADIRSVI